DPEPQVLVESLGSATINLRIYYWVDQRSHSGAKVGSILMRLIMRELERNGISMPDDSREIIFPQGVPVVVTGNEAHAPIVSGALPNASPLGVDRSVDALVDEDLEVGEHDDLSSDTDEIREQAAASRDPEQGRNIL
ncbi:mechanosensitive ion channel family protein, partial [Neptunomonas phycophila]|uniref:mechanosensitive ion channel family protein n=1 Tax=Neptunomonas phycophila TaxID=1572645 RepID=UPI0023F74FD0